MPKLSKEAISAYFRTECQRQLRFILASNKEERNEKGMPPKQPPLSGLRIFTLMGEQWEREKAADLAKTFGLIDLDIIIGNPHKMKDGLLKYDTILLKDALQSVKADQFILEGEYNITDLFEKSFQIIEYTSKFNLFYANVRPDIIKICKPQTYNYFVVTNGDVLPLPKEDNRLQLRVIDIKLTANPSKSYFAEVVYYIMVLTDWLKANDLDDRFIVVPNGGIWHGSHESSHLVKKLKELQKKGIDPTYEILDRAFNEDIQEIPYEVIFFRVRHFLQQTLPYVLTQDWKTLDWHVDSRCQNCDYAGFSYKDKNGNFTYDDQHCIPTAKNIDEICRVAGLSRGARYSLLEKGVKKVNDLTKISSEDEIFDSHQALRELRVIIPERANSLINDITNVPDNVGHSSIMPNWQDLSIFLSVNYDVGSDLAIAFGVKASWMELFDSDDKDKVRDKKMWPSRVFIVDTRDIDVEKRELMNFLNYIHNILQKAYKLNPKSTIQFYIWDNSEYKILTEIIGRHLDTILLGGNIRKLAWLFPPEELLKNEDIIKKSYITIVRDIIRSMLAIPTPHYYSRLKTAEYWHVKKNISDPEPQFFVHPLFKYELSDRIPSERAHEIWSRISTAKVHWPDIMKRLTQTINSNMSALQHITWKTQQTLRERKALNLRAPRNDIKSPISKRGLCIDSMFWYYFAKLNVALDYQENKEILALAPHIREAKGFSARLTKKVLDKREKILILNKHNIRIYGQVCFVYRLNPRSREVKLREGDFNFVLSPESNPNFLNTKLITLIRDTPHKKYYEENFKNNLYFTMDKIMKVSVLKIDREELIIILKPDKWITELFLRLLRDKIIDLNQQIILDPIQKDYFTNKLFQCLKAIGNPEISSSSELVKRALGYEKKPPSTYSEIYPVSKVLWDARTLNKIKVNRDLMLVKNKLQKNGIDLNDSQWQAWERALTTRLQLIWGPPGTGKSRTARTIILGAFIEAYNKKKPLRVLISSLTYRAMDIVLNVFRDLDTKFSYIGCEAYRLRSRTKTPEIDIRSIHDIIASGTRKSRDLLFTLENNRDYILVGGTPGQVFNLLTLKGDVIKPLFDLIIIDEASQLDVAYTILPLCSLAPDGSVILTGDLKQLSPIHQAVAPTGLESMVESIYSYCKDYQIVSDIMLSINYRSNNSIVKFSYNAGYLEDLTSNSPELKLNLLNPLPDSIAQPKDWPSTLYYTPEWSKILDPDLPVVCFVYPDGKSSQWNKFEALSIVSLVYLLQGRLANQLLNENGVDLIEPPSLYTPKKFWEKGIGIVTPHRAQQALIISKLQKHFADRNCQYYVDPHKIRDAVDTVERFQGQERDIIIASFALGDPDAIRNEEEFLTSLNRFNVMASRPRAKLIVFISEEVVNHLSNDIKVLNQSRLLKVYVESYCNQKLPMTLGYLEEGEIKKLTGLLKFKKIEYL